MNFQEAIKLIHECRNDPIKLQENQDAILEFLQEVEDVGTNVLASRGVEYATEFIAMAQTISLIGALLESKDMGLITMLMSDNHIYLSSRTLKIGLGMAVMEELR